MLLYGLNPAIINAIAPTNKPKTIDIKENIYCIIS